MPTLAFIRGWVNTGREDAPKIQRIVESVLADQTEFDIGEERARQLLKCWHFPSEHGLNEDFVLVGATVYESMVPIFVRQFARIAEEVFEVDGEDIYHLVGKIDVTVEGESLDQEWIISGGKLDTSTRRPYLFSL